MVSWTNIACLLKAKNNEGGLSVKPTEGLPFLLEPGMEVTFVPPVLRMVRSAVVEEVVEMGNGKRMVYFDAITDRNLAENLEGHFCLVPTSRLPEGFDQLQGSGLEGFLLYDPKAGLVGEIVDMQENPAHPLLLVKRTDGEELLVPLVEEFLVEVSDAKRTVTMTLPDGLLDL